MTTPVEEQEAWMDRIVASMISTWRKLARANGSDVFERDGVFGLRNPRVRERSVFNSVGYADPEALLAAREDLADFYAELGCAWTVWVREPDREVAAALESAGHALDAVPRAMGRTLEDLEEPDLPDIAWTAAGDMRTACLINDHAYGLPEGTWLKGHGERPEGYRNYLAEIDGNPIATVATVRNGEDCVIWSVATEPEARGRGLSTALMLQAIWDAAREGCTTTTLQATKLGRPVYERVGFRDFGALRMWELRPPELAGFVDHKPPA